MSRVFVFSPGQSIASAAATCARLGSGAIRLESNFLLIPVSTTSPPSSFHATRKIDIGIAAHARGGEVLPEMDYASAER